jgi:hypothetical protein
MCGATMDVRFGPKADICSALAHVRFGPIADILAFNPRGWVQLNHFAPVYAQYQ